MKIDDSKIEDFIVAAKKGDEKALSGLIDLVQPRLFRFCYYLTRKKELAEDICQDCLIKVLTKINSLKDSKLFISWIFKAAKNRFLDHAKSHNVVKTESIENKGDLHNGSDSQKTLTIIHINEVLRVLNEDERLIILLVDQQGYSYKEAAEIIGLSESALTSKIHRIRKVFLENFNKE